MLCYYFTSISSLSSHGSMFSIPLVANCITDEDMSRKFMQDKFIVLCDFQRCNLSWQHISALRPREICVWGMGDSGNGCLCSTFMPETLYSTFLIFEFLQLSYLKVHTKASPNTQFPMILFCVGCRDPGQGSFFLNIYLKVGLNAQETWSLRQIGTWKNNLVAYLFMHFFFNEKQSNSAGDDFCCLLLLVILLKDKVLDASPAQASPFSSCDFGHRTSPG